jgi:Cu/Ag efflux protein CusF
VKPDSMRKFFLRLRVVIVLTTAGFMACHQTTAPTAHPVTGPAAAVQTTTYQGVGTVKSIDLKTPSIEIDHEDIKGLMPAMTMHFYVQDKSLLQGFAPGNKINFTVEHGVSGLKVTAISMRQ